jgi:uncharacterized membrane protein
MRMRAWLAGAWDLVGADFPLFTFAASLIIALSMLSFFILTLPLVVGMCIMFLEKAQGRPAQLSHLWEGLTNHFPAAIVTWIIVMLVAIPFDAANFYLQGLPQPWPLVGVVIVVVGLWLIVTPLFFALPLIADRDLSGREAMQRSWALVRPRLGGVLLAIMVGSLALLLGLFACGIGILITLPVVIGALVLAYQELAGVPPTPAVTEIVNEEPGEVEDHEETQ